MLSNIGLVLAIPLSREEFESRLNHRSDASFVGTIAAQRPNLTPAGLWSLYCPIAKLALEIIEEAHSMGVRVLRQGGARHTAAFAHEHELTTLVAHWRNALFFEADVMDSRGISVELRNPRSRLALYTQSLARTAKRDFQTPEDNARAIASALSTLIRGAAAAHVGVPDDPISKNRILALTEYYYRHVRKEIVAILPNGFCGDAAVEMEDGFCAIDDFIQMFSPHFTGTIDLTICNSVMLGEELKRHCPQSLLLTNSVPAQLAIRLAFYRQILRRMNKHGEDYLDASAKIRSAVRKERQ